MINRFRTHALAAAAALLGLAAAAPSNAQVSDYKEIKIPQLHAVKIQPPKRIELANGMVIFLEEDHELPLIRGTANIRGGERDVPADKTGLAAIYGSAWRTGGTEKQTGDQLDEMLEARAATVETGGDADSTHIHMDVLKGDFDTVFPIFVDLLRHPAFRQDKIDLAKTAANTSIARRNDNADEITRRESYKLVYGPDSPYARQPEYATIASITRNDLVAFHDRFVHPNNIILGFVGDFDSAKLEKTLRETFGSWAKGPQAPKASVEFHSAKPGVYFVPKDDVTQSNIRMAHMGVQRNNPDYYAIVVMNEVLDGGSFSGRLVNDIRTKRGLAYAAGGVIGNEWDHPGVFRAVMGTKSGSTVEAIEAMKQDLAALASQPVTAEELQQAKDSLLNSYVFSIDSPSKFLDQRMTLEFYGYPADFWQKYPAGIQAVTAEQAAAAGRKYVKADQLITLVVGKEKDFDKPLSTLGAVNTVDVTIPEPGEKPGAAKAAAPSGSNAEGMALVKKMKSFVGAKVDTIKTTHATGTINVKTPQGPMSLDIDSTTMYPDHEHTVMKLPMGEMTMVVTPDSGFVLTPMGAQDLPGSRRDSMLRQLRGELHAVLLNSDKPNYTFVAGPHAKVGDVDAQELDVTIDGHMMKWWVDPATGRLLRKEAPMEGEPGTAVTEYSDWKSNDGVTLPMKFVSKKKDTGEEIASGEMKQIEINPTVDPKIYEKPAPK